MLINIQFKISSSEYIWNTTGGVDEGVPELISQVCGGIKQRWLGTTDVKDQSVLMEEFPCSSVTSKMELASISCSASAVKHPD